MAALAAYIACAAFVVAADLWDPLGEWGWGLVLASSLALGVTGRWPMLLAPLALIPLAPLNRMIEPELFTSGVYWLVGVCAVLVALGIGLRALARRRGARAERGAATAGLGVICLTSALTAWGVYLDQRVVDRSPSGPLLVDERTGAFRGIRPGASASRALSLFGRPVHGPENFAPTPLDLEHDDVSGPSSLPSSEVWRYRELVVLVAGERVGGYLTTDPSAQTSAGVGVGDSLAIAERAYARLDCFGVTLGSDAVNPSYPGCEGALRSGDWIWFGGDPIDSVWVLETDAIGGPSRPPIAAR